MFRKSAQRSDDVLGATSFKFRYKVFRRTYSPEKTLMLGKIEGRRRRGWTTEDEMVGWHHQLNGHEFE